ncbi:MAG TPA: PEPxxWA-CTERM sorting domain-containing protein [Sphingomonas sp.]|jgi:opacity protein-like surface antigen
MKRLYLAAALAATALTATSASAATPLTVTYTGTVEGTSGAGNLGGSVVFTGITTQEDANDGQFAYSSFTALYAGTTYTFANTSAAFSAANVLDVFTGGIKVTSFNFAPGTQFAVGEKYATTLGAGGTFLVDPSVGDVNFTGGMGSVTSSVAAVPEPATWAMLLVGFGMMSASMRYRRKNIAVSFA